MAKAYFKGYSIVKEGEEDEAFWEELGGKKEYLKEENYHIAI